MPIGQLFTTNKRYIKHPPYTSFYWQDKYSVDSGTAHIVHNNLSKLSQKNLRQICNLIGPGNRLGFPADKSTSGYSDKVDSRQLPRDENLTSFNYIYWDNYSSLRAGPFPGCAINLSVDPVGYLCRNIRAYAQITKGNGTASSEILVVCALTNGPGNPAINEPIVYATQTKITPGDYDLEFELEITSPIQPAREYICRADSDGITQVNQLIDLYLWLGWYSTNVNTTPANQDAIWSFSAFEYNP